MNWTIEQILALAPDSNTAKRGQGLAAVRKWLSLETDGRVVWGKCKSSGTAHYETAVDLKGPAFKCNCPSRKFPCKHSIGLLLLSASDTDGFKVSGDIPESISNWVGKRDAKSGTAKTEKTAAEIQKSQERKTKAFDTRMHLMQEGIKDLENWLKDVIRIGLASVDGSNTETTSTRKTNYRIEPTSEVWNSIAKRMVDAKLSGLGRRIREMAMIQGTGSDWPARMLAELSNLYLVINGFKKLEELPAILQKEILTISGVNTSKDDLLKEEGIEDYWMVVGQFEGTNIDNAAVRRTWFLGQETGRYALVLEYDYRNDGFPFHWPTGRIFKGKMFFYPSIFPLRAMMNHHEIAVEIVDGWGGCEDMQSFLDNYSETLGQNPWLVDYPVAFSNVYPKQKDGIFYLVDEQENGIPLMNIGFTNWKIMALSGGKPVDVFGEWTGEVFNPLSIVADYRFVAL